MSTEQINAMIAKFEGRKFYGHTIDKFGEGTLNELPEMKYHTSPDWLWSVIEKIEDMAFDIYTGFSVSISRRYCIIYCHHKSMQDGCIYQTPYGFMPDSKIHALFLAVVSFIQWYNSLQTPTPKL